MQTTKKLSAGGSSRRDFLGGCAAAVAATALPAPLLASETSPAAALLTRAIPSTGERLPIVGLGTNAYSVTDPAEIAKRQAVVARLIAMGAKVIDTARAYGDSELVVGRILQELKLRDRVFLATKTPIQGDLADPAQIVAETFRRLGTDTVDLLQIHNLLDWQVHVPTLHALRDAGRVRYLGITHYRADAHAELERVLGAEKFDWVQVNYSLAEPEERARLREAVLLSIDFDSQNAAYRFIVAGQVYVDGPNGRFSTAVQAGDEDGTIIAGRPGYVVGISVDAYDRTNLGCASDSPFAQTITARVYSAANVLLGTLSFDMNPWGWRQVGVDVGVTDGTMVISSTQRAVCFGVVVDNVSNDGTYQIAVPD